MKNTQKIGGIAALSHTAALVVSMAFCVGALSLHDLPENGALVTQPARLYFRGFCCPE